ncbi:unnamed protein product [marine sediment metagenome]|uniref:Uncharacterized protein n=1 Tax=marine sediment metagenome TaxID=412755 RepID=X1AUT0_9ZZZZ
MMDELETDETCDKCKKPISILVTDFEQIMKDGDLILCPDCETKMLDEQIEAERPPKRCFEYKLISIIDAPFESMGLDGWELVSVDNDIAYFKRENYEKT